MIERLQIKDFKVHANFDREFKNFTVILGRNNAGKTTILEAIFKALYPASFGAGFIRRGARWFLIRLHLKNDFVIEVKYSPRQVGVYKGINFLGEKGLSEIYGEFSLPSDPDRFKFLSFFEQGSLDSMDKRFYEGIREYLNLNFPNMILDAVDSLLREISRIKRSEEERVFRLLGGDKYSYLLGKQYEVQCELKRLYIYERNIKNEMDVVNSQIDDVERGLQELVKHKEEKIKLEQSLELYKERYDVLSKNLKSVENSLNPDLPDDIEFLQVLKDYLVSLEVFEDVKEKAVEYEKVKKDWENIRESVRENLRKMDDDLKSLREIYRSFGNLVSLIYKFPDNKVKDPSVEIDNLKKEREGIVSEMGHYRRRLESLKGGGDRCPVCDEPLPLDKRESLISESVEMLKKLSLNKQKIDRSLEFHERLREYFQKFEDEVLRIKEYLEQIPEGEIKERALFWLNELKVCPEGSVREVETFGRNLKIQRENLDNELKSKEKEYTKKITELEKYYAKYKSSSEDIKRLVSLYPGVEKFKGFAPGDVERHIEALREYVKIRDEMKEIKEKMETILLTLGEDKFRNLEERISYGEKTLKNLKDKMNELFKMYMSVSDRKSELERELLEIEGKILNIRESYRKIHNIDDKINVLKLFKFNVYSAHKKFITYLKLEFERILNEYFVEVFGFSNRYVKLEVDTNFEPVFHTTDGTTIAREVGGMLSVNRVGLSGGERTALGLAYRLALRRCLATPPPIMLLDEPTTHLDSERRESVWRILQKISENENIQIIAVTHDSTVEDVISKDRIIRLGG